VSRLDGSAEDTAVGDEKDRNLPFLRTLHAITWILSNRQLIIVVSTEINYDWTCLRRVVTGTLCSFFHLDILFINL